MIDHEFSCHLPHRTHMATTSLVTLGRQFAPSPPSRRRSIVRWCLGDRHSHLRTLLFFLCNYPWTIVADLAAIVLVMLSVPFAIFVSLQARPPHKYTEPALQRCMGRCLDVASRSLSVYWRVELSLLALVDPTVSGDPPSRLEPGNTSIETIQYVSMYILAWKTLVVLPATTAPLWIWWLGVQSLLVAGTSLTVDVLVYWTLYIVAGLMVGSVLCAIVVKVSLYFLRATFDVHCATSSAASLDSEDSHLLHHHRDGPAKTTYESLCDLKSPRQTRETAASHQTTTDTMAVEICINEENSPLGPKTTPIAAVVSSGGNSPPLPPLPSTTTSIPTIPLSLHVIGIPTVDTTTNHDDDTAAIPKMDHFQPSISVAPSSQPPRDFSSSPPAPLLSSSGNAEASSAALATLETDLATVEASILEYNKMLAQGPNNKLRRRLEKERKGFEDRREKHRNDIASLHLHHHRQPPQEQSTMSIPMSSSSHHLAVLLPTPYAPYNEVDPPDNATLSNSYLPPTHSFQPEFNSPVFRGTSGAAAAAWGSPVAYSQAFLASPSSLSPTAAAYDRLSPPTAPSPFIPPLSPLSLSSSSYVPPPPATFYPGGVPPVFRSLAPPTSQSTRSSDNFVVRDGDGRGNLSSHPTFAFVAPNPEDEPVHLVAYAPPCVVPASEFSFAVWAFLATQRDDMHDEASQHDPAASQLSRDVLFPLRRGARAHVSLVVPAGFSVTDGATTQALTWSGTPTAAHFAVVASATVAAGQVVFKATVVFGTSVLHLRAFVFVSGNHQPQPPTTRQGRTNHDMLMMPLQAELELLDETFDEIPFASLQLKELVGRGYFGDAYRADYNGRDVVVKTIRASDLGTSTDQIVDEFRHEAAVLNMFGHHPNIVPFVGASTDLSKPLTLVTEFVPGGNLEDGRAALTCQQKMQMLVDAAAGFLNIHDGGFIHRDIAARNCLVDVHRRVKVCDFGMCRRVNRAVGGSFMRDGVGPLKYMAPESLQPPYAFSTKSDAYSFGVLMWETLAEQRPFQHLSAHDAAVRVLEGGRLDVNATNTRMIPPPCAALMAACFQEDPAKRPSMHAILVALIQAQATMMTPTGY
ncbi:hypothetical protein DYB36_004501 [Aphanomyces astaci]|uniref:Protein kinase domain-containing protein n=1 Tax=Aphanomyces astaci TaxID=112090 RepID=A0A397B4U9_APHAT|nr:hypothetical protein DYB36_004501 [Aphanomyces astaci]